MKRSEIGAKWRSARNIRSPAVLKKCANAVARILRNAGVMERSGIGAKMEKAQ